MKFLKEVCLKGVPNNVTMCVVFAVQRVMFGMSVVVYSMVLCGVM